MSFSSFRIREDSCSGVGALSEREPEFSVPEGGAGRRWRNRSSMLLCSLRFRPCGSEGERSNQAGRHPSGNRRAREQLRESPFQTTAFRSPKSCVISG